MIQGTVFLATIIMSAPEFGLALVVSAEGTLDTKQLFLANLPLNDAGTGAITQANFVDGTTVVCLRNDNAPEKAYILAPANYAVGDIKDTTYGRSNYNVTEFKESDSTAFLTALENLLQGQSIDFRNFSHGADNDVLPGDTDIIDLNGNAGLHIGRFLSQLRGSPAAFIDVSNITNTIRHVATKEEQHLPLSVVLKGKELIVDDVAVTDAEAFGIAYGDPFTVSGNLLAYTDENAIPLYRMQETKGAAIDGKEELVVGFPFNGNVHYATTEPPVLAKRRISLSGGIAEASAEAISSIKSPAIRAIHQVNYDTERGDHAQDDILQPYDYKITAEPATAQPTGENAAQILTSDAAINKLIDTLFTGDYLERLKERLAAHGLKVSTSDGLLSNQISGQFITGPTGKQEYDNPPYIQLTDPVTGKVTTYYQSTSFITQEADGSILIADGYGSEIRMSKGNIYISPALDLFLRPGRDLSAMVPRHQSYNAQATTTINSSEAIYIRSVGDFKMIGATGGTGVVSLECAAQPSVLSGLLLKSMCGTTLIGSDLYIGINTNKDVSRNRVEEPQNPGTIIIDACSRGSINMRSVEQVMDAKSICLVTTFDTGNQGSAIVIKPSDIGIYTRNVSIPASISVVGHKAENQVTLVRDGEKVAIELLASTAPSVVIESDLIIGRNMACNGFGIYSVSVRARQVMSTSQYCVPLDTSYNDPFATTEIHKQDANTEIGETTADRVISISGTLYQDYYTVTNGFAFPTSYGISPNLRMPGMLWQTQTEEQGGGMKWAEAAVTRGDGENKLTTMCYPGLEVWENATISTRGYKTAALRSGYLTNAPQGR